MPINFNFNIETVSSKDIDELWLFFNTRIQLGLNGKNLNELFDNQQRFLASYNEWNTLKKKFISHNEYEYTEYMEHLETTNSLLKTVLTAKGISFDKSIATTKDFIKSQLTVYESAFPFAENEIIAWDSTNFIVRDAIYYSMTGLKAVFFLARLDKERN